MIVPLMTLLFIDPFITCTGIKHEDVLSEFEKEVNLEDIKSIQMTETSCIVTLNSEQAKYKILNSEILLKYRSVNLFEIDKNVTKVTIKDAPCEVSDQFIATYMSKYGESCILPVHCLELQYRMSLSSGLILYPLSLLLFQILIKHPHV
jgi:hypothetical protein